VRARPRRARAARARPRATLPSLFMLAALAYFLAPLAWLIIASSKSDRDLFSTFGGWFAEFNLHTNIRDLLFTERGGDYWLWLRNTAMYSVVSASGAAAIASAAGYGFAKYEFRGKNAMFWFVLGSVMVPTTALAIPTYLLFAEIGLTNNPLSIILPSLVSPFGIYLMRIYAEGAVPTELIEAARIDGAGELRTFLQIALRLLAPGFVTVLLFTFVATWNNYFLPLVMLSEPKWYPLTVGIRQLGSNSLVLCGSLVAIVPMILAFVLLQRYWQSGLATGGVKQ
jgi:multiple sugar transport system permease protein